MKCDVLIVGGGTGGVAAALGAAALGKSVILTEETDWIGGQLTSQAVPPDENQWIRENTHGCTRRYFDFRERVRNYYRRNHPLTEAAKNDPKLNPGGGGILFGSTSCGAVLQVPTHTVVESALANAKRANVQSNRRMSGIPKNE